jgi:chromosome segregation ATPase
MMNDQLQTLITDAEAELGKIDAQYGPLKDEFDKTTDAIAPQLDRLHVLETQMDELKPRKFELEHQLEHLRKINPEFDLHQRAKPADGDEQEATEKNEPQPPA